MFSSVRDQKPTSCSVLKGLRGPVCEIISGKHKQTYQELEIRSTDFAAVQHLPAAYHRHFLEQHDANAPLQQFCREHWKGTDKNRGGSWKHVIKIPDSWGKVAPIVVNLCFQESLESNQRMFMEINYVFSFCFATVSLKKPFLLKMQIFLNKNAQKLTEKKFFKTF